MNNSPPISAKNVIALAALIVALSIGYYFVIYLPQKDAKKAEELKDQENAAASTKLLLSSCLEDAKKEYSANWNSLCRARGKEDQCSLDDSDLARVEKTLTATKEECFRKYQSN